ncbi:hypothetical protein MJO28_001382 [Puccinia striiformis f. sp. tritici]|uniref:Uncharacterized protein n=1 Tax=Puccinia striiformis f. sp. tritici TaxID=168172 RepID=A0ACC0EWV1_9BASI|nr:hypothetical protein MJO28_001382 [Puccinia striiformis f. sp. tritici]
MNSNSHHPIYLIPKHFSRFDFPLPRLAPLKSITNMSRATSLEDIDSLPYHALQAEAQKHSIRRNLGAVKLRQALKHLLGENPDPAELPQQWFIAAAKAEPAKPTGPPRGRGRPTKTNARITAAQKKAVQDLPAPQSPSRTVRPQNPLPSPTIVPAVAPPPPASGVPANRSPTPRLNNNLLPSPRNVPIPARSPVPHASTSRVPQVQSPDADRTGDTTAQIFKAVADQGRLKSYRVPQSNYTSPPGGSRLNPGALLPEAIRQEAKRMGLTRVDDQRNIDFLSYLVRDCLQELDQGKKLSCIIRASRMPIRQLPIYPPASPSNPVVTSRYDNYHYDSPPGILSEPFPTTTPTESPIPRWAEPATHASTSARVPASPSIRRNRGSNAPSPETRDLTQLSGRSSRVAFRRANLPSVSPSPASRVPNRVSLTRRLHERLSPIHVSTPPLGTAFNPPSVRSPDLPRVRGSVSPTATEQLNLRRAGGSQAGALEFDELEAIYSSPSESSDDDAASRDFIENMLSVETSFYAPLPSTTPSRRKRIHVEDDSEDRLASSFSNKKAKLTSPFAPSPPRPSGSRILVPATSSQVPSSSLAQVPSSSLAQETSSSLAPVPSSSLAPSQPPKPLKFFSSAKKARAIRRETPPPAPSPEGPASQPTLYGTEHYYTDSSDTRFAEDPLLGRTRLMPSPLVRRYESLHRKR